MNNLTTVKAKNNVCISIPIYNHVQTLTHNLKQYSPFSNLIYSCFLLWKQNLFLHVPAVKHPGEIHELLRVLLFLLGFLSISFCTACSILSGLSPDDQANTHNSALCILAKTHKGDHCSWETLVNTLFPPTDHSTGQRRAGGFNFILSTLCHPPAGSKPAFPLIR